MTASNHEAAEAETVRDPVARAQLLQYQQLADVAMPINDDDYASERQTDAENALWDALDEEGIDLGDAFRHYALKATAEERIVEALAILTRRAVAVDSDCADPTCADHGDDLFCEACTRWVADETAPCPALPHVVTA